MSTIIKPSSPRIIISLKIIDFINEGTKNIYRFIRLLTNTVIFLGLTKHNNKKKVILF